MVRELYGLKGYGSAWVEEIRKKKRSLGLQHFMANAYFWMRSSVDTSTIDYGYVTTNKSAKNLLAGDRYWEYALIYIVCFLLDSCKDKCIMEAVSGL